MCRPTDVPSPYDALGYPHTNPLGTREQGEFESSKGYSEEEEKEGVVCLANQHESLSERLTRLKKIYNSVEEALDHARAIEDDYRRGALEAHLRGAMREVVAQRAELVDLVSSLSTTQRNGHTRTPLAR